MAAVYGQILPGRQQYNALLVAKKDIIILAVLQPTVQNSLERSGEAFEVVFPLGGGQVYFVAWLLGCCSALGYEIANTVGYENANKAFIKVVRAH